MKKQGIILLIALAVIGGSGVRIVAQNTVGHTQKPFEKVDTLLHSLPFNYLGKIKQLDTSRKKEISSYKDLLDLFEEYEYTAETWKEGLREVPRLYVCNISEKWGDKVSKEIGVSYKKQIFFRVIAPLALRANELILEDRERLLSLSQSGAMGNTSGQSDRIWLRKLARLYKVEFKENVPSMTELYELKSRVDMVPPSLALSQAAAESGWGTSDFAFEGNALFGQWSWGEDAMIPDQQREHLGNYGIAVFESLQESVSAYMLNLNRHYAYKEFRELRAQLRNKGEALSGYVLAEGLSRYSENGESYVKYLRSIIDYNKLGQVDETYLSDLPPLYLQRQE